MTIFYCTVSLHNGLDLCCIAYIAHPGTVYGWCHKIMIDAGIQKYKKEKADKNKGAEMICAHTNKLDNYTCLYKSGVTLIYFDRRRSHGLCDRGMEPFITENPPKSWTTGDNHVYSWL